MKIQIIKIEKGFIQTNEYSKRKNLIFMRLVMSLVGLQLAHVASHEGIIAVEHIAGENPDTN